MYIYVCVCVCIRFHTEITYEFTEFSRDCMIILGFVCEADHYVRNITTDGFSQQLNKIVKGLNLIKNPREGQSFAGFRATKTFSLR